MIISGLDFGLIICLSYLTGIGSGLMICCKYKDRFLVIKNLTLSLIWACLMAMSRKMVCNVKPRVKETSSGPVV